MLPSFCTYLRSLFGWGFTYSKSFSWHVSTLICSQADFLKGLPVYNENNFSRFHSDSVCKASVSWFGCVLLSLKWYLYSNIHTYMALVNVLLLLCFFVVVFFRIADHQCIFLPGNTPQSRVGVHTCVKSFSELLLFLLFIYFLFLFLLMHKETSFASVLRLILLTILCLYLCVIASKIFKLYWKVYNHLLFCLLSVIVTEKTNILLRYLHQQWDKKVGGSQFKFFNFRFEKCFVCSWCSSLVSSECS